MELTINRNEWYTGRILDNNGPYEKYGISQLLNFHGYKCCLGFLGLHCGISEEKLKSCGLPSSTFVSNWPQKLFKSAENYLIASYNVSWEDVFSIINDAMDVDDNIREAWVKEGFKTILNIDIKFIGSYDS